MCGILTFGLSRFTVRTFTPICVSEHRVIFVCLFVLLKMCLFVGVLVGPERSCSAADDQGEFF